MSRCNINVSELSENVRKALAEDIGAGDLTAQLLPENGFANAELIVRENAILCGQAWFDEVLRQVDAQLHCEWFVAEGAEIFANTVVAKIKGPARALLTAERSALNFLQLLSAVATQTRQYLEQTKGTKALILDTRKTIPGLRFAQKYAVRVGGGQNQRIGLYDAILIKENHIAAAGGVTAVLKKAREKNSNVSIQIEVETLAELKEALNAGAELILLDNFSLEQIRSAVNMNQQFSKPALLEVSGGVSLNDVRAIALTGVDRISIGGLTKNIRAIDFSLKIND